MIGGRELNIDPINMEAIMKWPFSTNVIEVRSFVGVVQYLKKFIASFSAVVAPLHTITSGKSFQWGKNQHKAFDEIKRNINQALFLALPILQNPFEVMANASGYCWVCVIFFARLAIVSDLLH
jgi:hypothetical protein